MDITILTPTKSSETNSTFSVLFGLRDFTNNMKYSLSHIFSLPILKLNLGRIHQQSTSKLNDKAYLHTGFYFCVLVHNGKDGLHTTVFHQIRFVPNQYQRQPKINRAHFNNKEGKRHQVYILMYIRAHSN